MNALLGLAVFFLILWLVLRIALAVTGVFLHLLWVIAIILVVVWIFRKLTSK